MGYDAGLYINTGKEEALVTDCGNYTYNVSPMLRLALDEPTGIYALDGSLAKDCVTGLGNAITRMENSPEVYKALAPQNGWGSYEGCLRWLEDMLYNCQQHPLATLRIT